LVVRSSPHHKEHRVSTNQPRPTKAQRREAARLKAKGEDRLFRKVVKGMLPKNRLGDKLLGNLYVYAGTEHKHEAQQPKSIDINSLN